MKSLATFQWKTILHYVIGWTFAFLFLSFVRGEGTQELGSVQFELKKAFLASLVMGPFFGGISGFVQILFEKYAYKHVSLFKLFIFRIIYAVLFLMLLVTLAYVIFGENISLLEFAFEPGSFAIYFFIICVEAFMFGLRQVNLFLGEGNLWKLLVGKFYTPREERRIFMFLDLQSSTEHAERLGHIKYSKMIQDLFYDISIVMENEAEIYQYVGDEIVLTWKLAAGCRNENCLRAYFNYHDLLDQRASYYQTNYGCSPFFKAGLNVGMTTVTEVGKYKKEIAYHGDTLNTASRIQGMCNELNQSILVSEQVHELFKHIDFTFSKIGQIALRGKQLPIDIYSVQID